MSDLLSGPALFLDVTVHEASDVNSDDVTMLAGILGALLGCVVLLCVSNLAIALCICCRRRSRKASAGPGAASSKSLAPIIEPSKDEEKPLPSLGNNKGGMSTEDEKSGPSGTDEEKPNLGKTLSFVKMRSKSTEKAPDTPAVAKKGGWFGRKKQQGADEEAPARITTRALVEELREKEATSILDGKPIGKFAKQICSTKRLLIGLVAIGIITIIVVVALGVKGMFNFKFGSKFDTNNNGACGTESNGGIKEQPACCMQQTSYCQGACKPDLDPNKCLVTCTKQRGCDPETFLTCTEFGTFKASNANKCGSEGQGGTKCESECCPAQKSFCRSACRADLNPNGCLVDCLEDRGCDFNSTGLTCDDFGTFSAGSDNNQCGSEVQGGTQCKSECCPAQKDYCRSACRADLNPNGCLVNCLNDRGCDFNSTGLTCDDFGTFSAGPDNQCGSEGQGGTQCESECCPAQKDYCRSACRADLNPIGCLVDCLNDRGCDFNSTGLTCDDFGTFSAGPDNQCGSELQGGTQCKSECCPAQKDYCRSACRADLNPNGCLVDCLDDRGCDSNSTGLTCDDFGTFSAGPDNQCGSKGQGGTQCESECCPAQNDYCRTACRLDLNPIGCLVDCLNDRGCDFNSTGLTCDDFGTFSAGPDNQCGSELQGGTQCKSECCPAQKDYCSSACRADLNPNGCLVDCLDDRGCDFNSTGLACDDFGIFSAGPDNQCGSEGQGGTQCKSECCPAQKDYCRSACRLDLNPIGCLEDCLNDRGCDFNSTGLTCDDFGTFSAGPDNQCGSEVQGGTQCKSECCSAQKDYCSSACRADLNPNGCLVDCLNDRGCDFNSSGLTCDDFGTFSAGPDNQCGSKGQGGTQCESECCPAQKGYCRSACRADLNPNGCLVDCLGDRGCDFENTGLTCDDFGTFSAGPDNLCGSKGQGGTQCESECCPAQKDYCRSACRADLNPIGCLEDCLNDRGCDFDSTGLTCDDFGTFSAGPDNQCGSELQGGTQCKSECCPAQKDYCRTACRADSNPNGCLVNCLDDRGCDFDSTGLTCDDFGTFSAGPDNKCGSEGQGGTQCKSECCTVQNDYCNSACVFNNCKNKCNADRGC